MTILATIAIGWAVLSVPFAFGLARLMRRSSPESAKVELQLVEPTDLAIARPRNGESVSA